MIITLFKLVFLHQLFYGNFSKATRVTNRCGCVRSMVAQGSFAFVFVHKLHREMRGRVTLGRHVCRPTMQSVFVYLFVREFQRKVGKWEAKQPWSIHS